MNIKGDNGDKARSCCIKRENSEDYTMSFIRHGNTSIEKNTLRSIKQEDNEEQDKGGIDTKALTQVDSEEDNNNNNNGSIDVKLEESNEDDKNRSSDIMQEDSEEDNYNGGIGMIVIKQEDNEEVDNGGINLQSMHCDKQEHSEENDYEIGKNVKVEEVDETNDSTPASSEIIENSRIKVEDIEAMDASNEVERPTPSTSPHLRDQTLEQVMDVNKEEEQDAIDRIPMSSPVNSSSVHQPKNVNKYEVEEWHNRMPFGDAAFPFTKEVKTEKSIETVEKQPIVALKDPPSEDGKEILSLVPSSKLHHPLTETKGSNNLTNSSSMDWINDMEVFLTQVPHGRKSAVCSKTNAKSVIRQVKKLTSGKGVDYKHWKRVPKKFGEGETINLLSTNFDILYEKADKWELKYGKDKGHGWLLKHPIMKLKLFQAYCRKQEAKIGFITSKL